MVRLQRCDHNVLSPEKSDPPIYDEARSSRLLTLADFLKEYRVGRTRAFHLIKTGQLPFRHAGRRLVIFREDAETWAKSLPLARSVRGASNG